MSAPAGWITGARAAGFTPEPGGLQFHRIGMTLATDGDWATLSHPSREMAGAAPPPQLGLPGLWRRFAAGRAEFDFPPRPVLGGSIKFEELLDWAILTADGREPRGFVAPLESEVLDALGPGALLARAGATLVRGEVRREEHRLSIAFPGFLRLPSDLSDARRAWITRLCDDAQRQWRLVRIGFEADGAALGAEVDLTGAPPQALFALAGLGATSLRTVLEWVLPALRLAADPTVSSEILNHPPKGQTHE